MTNKKKNSKQRDFETKILCHTNKNDKSNQIKRNMVEQ